MKPAACGRAWEIAPYREGRLEGADARSFERHLAACSECRQELAGDERLRERALSAYEKEAPGELAVRRVRARVLRDAEQGRVPARGRGAWVLGLGVAATCAAIAGAWVATTRTPRASSAETAPASVPAAPSTRTELAATVVPSEGARWAQHRADDVERVTLEEGSLHIHVRPQQLGERFLVVLPDGVLEVRGTTFDVRVVAGVTLGVHVDEGVVELRLGAQPSRRLAAGDDWPAIAQAPLAGPSRRPHSSLPAVPAAPAGPAGLAAPAADDAYARAMGLLRAGKDDDAATAFHAFAQGYPGASQAEDASFLEAVALARGGRTDAAGLVAEHHLAAFPRSFHRREASVLVARAALFRGDCARARAALAPWPGDADTVALLRACPVSVSR